MDLDADADEEFGGDDDDDRSTVPGFPPRAEKWTPSPKKCPNLLWDVGTPPPPTYSLAFVALCLGIPLHLIVPLLDPCL